MTIQNASRRFGATFLTFLMSFNVVQSSWAKSTTHQDQIAKDVRELDSFSKEYNSKPKDTKKVEKLLSSYEKFMGRKLAEDERKFLSLQISALNQLPRFEVQDRFIKIFDSSGGSKDLLLSLEVVDAQKNIFKYGGKTIQLDATKPLQENVQQILILIQSKEASSSAWLKLLSPFGLPQAHAEFPTWLKALLILGVAVIAGIFIGKALQKNQAKLKNDNPLAVRAERTQGSTHHREINAHEAAPSASEAIPSTGENTLSAPVTEPTVTPVTSGAEPSIV